MRTLRLVGLLVVVLVVTGGLAEAKTWKVPGHFDTIQEAIDGASAGDTIRVGPGTFYGGTLDKPLTIKGKGQAIIDDGPLHPAGITFGLVLGSGADGSTISHLKFDGVDLAVYASASNHLTDVTVNECRFLNALQAISAWGATGWEISHNTITDLHTRNGGGIGILVADWTGGIVAENVVSHNNIRGTLFVDPADGGGYSGSGIVIYADFRFGRSGAEAITENLIKKNKVDMASDTPSVVDIVAFELTDTQSPLPDPYCDDPVLFDNSIGFNDWRGTELQMALTPDELEDCNWISRNLGKNRGHGLHPKFFK